MNSVKKYHEMKLEANLKEKSYKLFTKIKKPAIKLLKEWHL